MDTQEEDWKHVGFALVVAMDENGGIGFQGGLPWPWLEEDMRRFRMLTEGSVVVMGRKTYLSIPKRNRPLKNRLNVVLTRSGDHPAMRDELGGGEGGELVLAESLAKVEEIVERNGERKKVFVIGGGEIFKMALENPKWSTRVYLTTVHEKFESDVFFPKDCLRNEFDESMLSNRMREKDLEFSFSELRRRSSPMSPNHGESQYLNLIKEIIEHGNRKGDRTGTGTRSIFGAQMRFDLRESFPILTTRRVFWRGVVEELLWFIKGSTNAQDLRDKDIHIWDGNGSRSFLDAMGFTEREEWDLGPVYGFQWRHFGAEYHGMHADYSGQGVDQLAQVIDTIKTNPNDRRIILTAWNPKDLQKMVLPPCHLMCQFYVNDGELSCQMYQRSCDMGLGVPFNIASYSLLTCMVAKVCGLRPGDFVHTLGDAHVYENHVEPLLEQLSRTPRPFPQLRIRDRPDLRSMDDFRLSDLELIGYNPHAPIKMTMAV
uniref:Bifunctional dihydrofolate reductase-thymidylate synthase n=1 Tax=Compsopogon caeruleus TaxID=31354 RepID=A0A7S1TFD9_9RHOD|mmetsp:Transcript_3773/g.7204  ORF Transcript_3773/g.7204 Transcript_3773/m.7204 type:complete len:486 (+) Transcript_3773:96-1553(+)